MKENVQDWLEGLSEDSAESRKVGIQSINISTAIVWPV